MTPSLNEKPMQGQETFETEAVVYDAVRAVFANHRFQAVERSGLEIHAETPPLELA